METPPLWHATISSTHSTAQKADLLHTRLMIISKVSIVFILKVGTKLLLVIPMGQNAYETIVLDNVHLVQELVACGKIKHFFTVC